MYGSSVIRLRDRPTRAGEKWCDSGVTPDPGYERQSSPDDCSPSRDVSGRVLGPPHTRLPISKENLWKAGLQSERSEHSRYPRCCFNTLSLR